MKLKQTITGMALACALACCVAFAGCAPNGQAGPNEEQKANRAYMSQVNETMVELDAGLDQFIDAVSRGDVVNMRTQANTAYKSLDKLTGIEAPEALTNVKKSYDEGASKLREALDAYIALYSEMAQKNASFDKATYDKRIAEIQAHYDAGVKALEEGDKKAAEA